MDINANKKSILNVAMTVQYLMLVVDYKILFYLNFNLVFDAVYMIFMLIFAFKIDTNDEQTYW